MLGMPLSILASLLQLIVSSNLCPVRNTNPGVLTLSDPMSDLVRHYGFPVPDAFLDL
jgi:hypothetical protein